MARLQPTAAWILPSLIVPIYGEVQHPGLTVLEVSDEIADWLKAEGYAVDADEGLAAPEGTDVQETSFAPHDPTDQTEIELVANSANSEVKVIDPEVEAETEAEVEATDPEVKAETEAEEPQEEPVVVAWENQAIAWIAKAPQEEIVESIKGIGAPTAAKLKALDPLIWDAVEKTLNARQIDALHTFIDPSFASGENES